jgi:glucose/arabinose dehydrogenase
MRQMGADVPSPNRIALLRDADGDGISETKSKFLEGLTSPFGMALVGQDLYVADTPYREGATKITAPPEKVADFARRRDQPSLDQERHREPRWFAVST